MKEKNKTKEQLIGELAEMRKCITSLKRCKARFKKKQEQLDKELFEYEKLSALGRLTANVAHEIRNPITIIGGLARRLEKSPLQDTKQEEYLQLIVSEAKRLEDILKDVLTFSKKPFSKRAEHDINELTDKCISNFKTLFKEHSITANKSFGDIPRIYIAKKEVNEAINNLVLNAIDAMPYGGTLTVATTIDYLNQKNYAALKISDTGMGIPEENLKMIFEPFFTTKMNKQETGLGLSITKKILELHGGLVQVESIVGKGSTFSLYFPYRSKS